VREEIEHIRQGKHGARSPEQAIAIGLSKARRAGVELPPPKKGTVSEATRKRAERDVEVGRKQAGKPTSAKRSRMREEVMKRESRSAATPASLSKHAKKAAAARKRRGKVTGNSAGSSKQNRTGRK